LFQPIDPLPIRPRKNGAIWTDAADGISLDVLPTLLARTDEVIE